MRLPTAHTLLVLLASLPAFAHAQEDRWGLCAAAPEWTVVAPLPEIPDEAIRFNADNADIEATGLATLTGDVRMTHGDQTLIAERVTYDRRTQELTAEGNVSLVSPELAMRGPRMETNVETGEARVESAEYFMAELHGRGNADSIERPDENTVVLHGASYTTCDEGREAWLLSASRVKLDQAEAEGTAHHAVLRVGKLPVMYTPWISFPIGDARKSGFLAPSFGDSGKRGFEFQLPYYWNIAPNYDATFSPRYMSRRGTQLNGEFRYLTESSGGDLQLAWLDDDLYEDDRWLGRFRNTTRPTRDSRIDIDLNGVSDDTYFDDLDSSLDVISTTHLERRADARWWWDYGSLLVRAQGFQTIDETLTTTQHPYRRLPQVLFEGGVPDAGLGLDYTLRTEWVRFDHDENLTGERVDFLPAVSLPLRTPGAFIEPRAAWRYTSYRLDDSLPADQREPDRSVPTYSLDSGLIFEREASAGTRQTLEPRLFYVYTPYRDQDDLPVFDTAELDFSYAQLFREDRFSGADRVADADQLSVALTTRFIDTATGRERLRASIGEVFYFDDRRVTLPGELPQTDGESDLAAEVGARLGDFWKIDGSLLWNPEAEQTNRSSARIQYRPDSQRVVNLSHRYRRDDFEQAELSFGWPLTRRWNGVGRWVYDLDGDRDLEVLGGLEYESCCWKLRLVGRNYVTDNGTEYNSAVYVQLVLKGLAAVGQDIEDLLEEGILGYDVTD